MHCNGDALKLNPFMASSCPHPYPHPHLHHDPGNFILIYVVFLWLYRLQSIGYNHRFNPLMPRLFLNSFSSETTLLAVLSF